MKQQSTTLKLLNIIEKAGNKLPHPAALFFILAIATLIFSAIASWFGLSAAHPISNETISVINLLTIEGLHRILNNMVSNFINFPPLGVVVVALLAFGIAEYTGLLQTLLRATVIKTPKKLITVVVVFLGVMSNIASDAGYVVFIPLAGLIFLAAGRHPIAGIAAGFAGVSGGFTANLLIGTTDPLLAGLSTAAAQLLDPAYDVSPIANYYFIAVSTFLITALGYWVTEKIIVPRLGEYQGNKDSGDDGLLHISNQQTRGLRWAGLVALFLVILLVAGLVPDNGFLRNQVSGELITSPVLRNGLLAVIFLLFTSMSLAFGIASGTIKNNKDAIKGFEANGNGIVAVIVVFFFAAQFIAYFNWSNLGIILALKGAGLLQQLGADTLPLIVALIIMSSIINLFIGSASAKWALMAPVFVPMFMLLGVSPELTQAAYRVGDSVTNIITPMFPYIGLILVLVQRYDKNSGLGTIMALMVPYSLVFFIGWTLLLLVWIWLGIPLGPGAGLTYQLTS